MQTIHSLTSFNDQPLAMTIGNFDGVHIGHQAIFAALIAKSTSLDLTPAAMTFSPHAKVFFGLATDFLITSESEKIAQIAAAGIEALYNIPFNADFSRLSPEAFLLALKNLNVRYLLVGDDFCFGHKGQGDFALLQRFCAEHHIGLSHTPTIDLFGERVSSSRIRRAIKACDFVLVEQLMGRKLTYRGEVQRGRQLGRTIGFPTANIHLPISRLLPDGVFAVRVRIDSNIYQGMCNIGTRPTVADDDARKIEVNVFDFDGNIYAREIAVEIVAKIRDEQKFDGVEALVAQLRRDKLTARERLNG